MENGFSNLLLGLLGINQDLQLKQHIDTMTITQPQNLKIYIWKAPHPQPQPHPQPFGF